jgi:hypothetical protein
MFIILPFAQEYVLRAKATKTKLWIKRLDYMFINFK